MQHQGQCQNLRHTKTGKTIYSKPLKKVWLWWQDYSSNNTLLIDDSQEKTSMNPVSCVACLSLIKFQYISMYVMHYLFSFCHYFK